MRPASTKADLRGRTDHEMAVRWGPMRCCVLAVAMLVLQSCTLSGLENIGSEPSLASSFVRPEDPQEAIGAREHPLVLAKYGGEYRNQETERMLALVVGRLISVSDDPSRVYKVTILNTPKVNAFALPGGYLYITRGLLALANDSSEIAAVIAHEMAHVTANHAVLRQEKISNASVGEEVVNEVLSNTVAGRVALAANQLKLSDFSREQELQADAIGIRMIGRSGFDPYAAARFLETMQTYQALMAGNDNQLDDVTFLSSHPTTPQRIELAKRHARFFGAPGIGDRDRDRYLAGIDGLLFGDTADEGFVRGNVFSHSGLGVTFSAPAGSRLDNQPKAVIVTGPGDAATRFDAAVIGRFQSLEAYLKSGWVNGLKEESVALTTTASGLAAATAEAETDGWRFRVKVIQIDKQVYRFITAMPAGSADIIKISDLIAGSFRKLTDKEIQALSPLRVRVVELDANDRLGALARRMRSGPNRLQLLRVLNGLQPGELPKTGDRLKIIKDK